MEIKTTGTKSNKKPCWFTTKTIHSGWSKLITKVNQTWHIRSVSNKPEIKCEIILVVEISQFIIQMGLCTLIHRVVAQFHQHPHHHLVRHRHMQVCKKNGVRRLIFRCSRLCKEGNFCEQFCCIYEWTFLLHLWFLCMIVFFSFSFFVFGCCS